MTTLYEKYRPTSFKEVIGQTSVVRSLKGVLEAKTNRTFLFGGPSGVGKTTLARIAAAQVGCGPGDILDINAAKYTGVNDMRSVIDTLLYRPLSGSEAKAVIVDECHRLSSAAWDSILKPLEEPPSWAFWFLCSTDLEKVPRTVQTRATRYTLNLVRTDEIVDLLMEVAEAEGFRLDESIIALCAKEALGSPRSALVNLGACCKAKSPDEARKLLQTVGESAEAFELARALVAGRDWTHIRGLLEVLHEENPESIRRVIQAYVVTTFMGSTNMKNAETHLAILDAFSTPFDAGAGMAPLLLAIGRLLFA